MSKDRGGMLGDLCLLALCSDPSNPKTAESDSQQASIPSCLDSEIWLMPDWPPSSLSGSRKVKRHYG